MKQALLYSTGMDSFTLRTLYPNIEPIYFNLGGRYSKMEIDLITKADKRVFKTKTRIVHLGFYDTGFEQLNGYIPYRNFILFLKASLLGYDELYFGMVNEWQRDKNKRFFRSTERFIAEQFSNTLERKFKIITPFYGWSKTKVLRTYLQHRGDPSYLYKYSRSCVAPTTRECGACISCLSKYIALVNNDLYIPGHFIREPRVDDFLANRKERFFSDFQWGRIPSTIGKLLEAYDAKRKESIRS